VALLSLFTFLILAVASVSAAVLIFYFEDHYWLIPAFFLFNVLVSWAVIKHLILKSFLFSYGQSFITNRELRSLNE